MVLAIAALLALTPATASATSLPTGVKPALSDAASDIEVISTNGCRVPLARTAVRTDCKYGDPYGTKKVALVGDSHAAHLFQPLHALAKARHWKLNIQIKISCRFVDLPIVSRELDRRYTECEQWRLNVVDYLQSHPQDMVIFVVARGMAVLPDRPQDDDPAAQGHGLARLMAQIPGKHVVIVDTPTSYFDVPACLKDHRANIEACATERPLALSWRHLTLEQTAVADDPGATLVNLTNKICPPADYCQAVLNGYIVWRDFHHLTKTFARTLQTALGNRLPAP